jgi:hypothetical protein
VRILSGFSAQPVTVWPTVPEKPKGLNPRPGPAEAVHVPLMKFPATQNKGFLA